MDRPSRSSDEVRQRARARVARRCDAALRAARSARRSTQLTLQSEKICEKLLHK
jgi:hypothetical protein